MEEKVDERKYLMYVELPNLINRITKLIMVRPFSWRFLEATEKELKKIVSSEFQGAIKSLETLRETHVD